MTKKAASVAATPDDQEKQEVFNMLTAEMTNVEICKAAGLAYTQVLAYRIAFEKRGHGEAKHTTQNSQKSKHD